ncbi:hypothetical protein ACFFIY_12085 [Bhargavaea ullalensis]|uniref:Lantibiotic dehydratase, C terminus n=1 Tax=Bhargavaea ullalensis TaxID=1265685 RepID=A0ABV2G7E9_9BACL
MNVKPVKLAAELYPYPTAYVHSLPTSILDGFVVSTTLDILQQVNRRRAAVNHAAKMAEKVFNRYGLSMDEFQEADLPSKFMNDEEENTIGTWVRRKEDLKEALVRLNVIYRLEQERVARKIVGTLEMETMRKQLAVQHSELLDKIGKGVPKNSESLRQLAEEALPYVLDLTISNNKYPDNFRFGFSNNRDQEKSLSAENSILLSRKVIQCWLSAMAKNPRLNSGFIFRVNDGLLGQNGKRACLQTSRGAEFIMHAEPVPSVHLKKGTARKKKDWVRSFRVAGGEEQFNKLVALGLLVPIISALNPAKRPLRRLSDALKGTDPQETRRLRRLFLLLDATLETMQDTDSRAIRRQRERAVRLVNKIQKELELATLTAAQETVLFEEKQSLVDAPVPLPEKVQKEMEEFASELPLSVVRSNLAGSMTRFFVDQAGRGGTCRDVLEFIAAYANRPDKIEESIRIAKLDSERAGRSSAIPSRVGPSEMHPNGLIQFRISAHSSQALERGDYQLLINEISTGCRIPDVDADWKEKLNPGAEVIHFSYGDGNVEGRFEGRELIWSTSWDRYAGNSKQLTLTDLTLEHDEHTDSLRLVAPEGHTVCVAYTGEKPIHQLPEMIRLFLSISNPWVGVPKLKCGKLVPGHSPRVTKGRVVSSAAEWRVLLKDVPLIDDQEEDFDYFIRLHDWLAKSGIPKEVTFRIVDPKFPVMLTGERDKYIHFGIPHLVRRFCKETKEAGGSMLVVTEVFPERGAHVVGRMGHPCVTEFQVPVIWHG